MPAPSAAPPAPPPVAATPPAPPVVTPQPAAAPVTTAPAAPPEADKAEKKAPPYASSLAIEGLVGVHTRLDSTSSGYENNESFGIVAGGGLFYNLSRTWAVGINYQRAQAGAEQFEPGENFSSGKLSRTYHSVFANLRAYPLRNDVIGLWAGLSLGATWQNAVANGTTAPGGSTWAVQAYKTETPSAAGLAMGLGVGFDLDVSQDVAFLGSLNLMNHFLKSESLTTSAADPYVPGSGTSTWLDVRAAFQYRFDLGGAKSPVNATVRTSKR